MDFLKKIQEKPPHVRAQYALAAASVFTLVITGVWFATLPARLAAITAPEDVDAQPSSLVKTLKSVGGQLGSVISGTTDSDSEESVSNDDESETKESGELMDINELLNGGTIQQASTDSGATATATTETEVVATTSEPVVVKELKVVPAPEPTPEPAPEEPSEPVQPAPEEPKPAIVLIATSSAATTE